jgi:hypothetical protein
MGEGQRSVNAQTFEIRGNLSKRIKLKRYNCANSGEIVKSWKLIVNIMYNAWHNYNVLKHNMTPTGPKE